MSVSMSPDGNMVRIKLNMELPFAKALEIQQIIRNHFKRNDEEGQ